MNKFSIKMNKKVEQSIRRATTSEEHTINFKVLFRKYFSPSLGVTKVSARVVIRITSKLDSALPTSCAFSESLQIQICLYI